MSISEIIGVSVPIAVAVLSVVVNIITLFKKNKKASVLAILGSIPSLVAEAEQVFGSGNGTAKLQWVLTKIQIACVKSNVDIDEETIKSNIESVLETPQKKETTEIVRTDVQT